MLIVLTPACQTMADTTQQTEKAFQKQKGVFQNHQRVLGKKKGKGKGARFWKNVGLGFKTPKEAIEGSYVDQNCPFTGTPHFLGFFAPFLPPYVRSLCFPSGNISIRGRLIKGA